MEKVITKLKEEKIIERFCDICGESAVGRQCRICQRDICEKHTHRQFDEWGGDYSYKYCIQCWKIGEPFRRRKSVLSEIYEKEIEDLENEWKRKALEQISDKNSKKNNRNNK